MAARDPRITARITHSPIIDLHAYMASSVGFDPAQMPPEDDIQPQDINRIPPNVMPAQTREMPRNLTLHIGRPSARATHLRLRDYRVDNEALRGIHCLVPALVGSDEGKKPLALHAHFLQTVAGPAASHVFTPEEGAAGHCQTANLGYSAAVSMDWLDEV